MNPAMAGVVFAHINWPGALARPESSPVPDGSRRRDLCYAPRGLAQKRLAALRGPAHGPPSGRPDTGSPISTGPSPAD
ncbi:MAG: hypothetical protein MZU97_12345 [Bacillus subtilis]|nr:hypothetical protein [Bacillus subtilis]